MYGYVNMNMNELTIYFARHNYFVSFRCVGEWFHPNEMSEMVWFSGAGFVLPCSRRICPHVQFRKPSWCNLLEVIGVIGVTRLHNMTGIVVVVIIIIIIIPERGIPISTHHYSMLRKFK